MYLEDIRLSEISQSQKDKCCMILFIQRISSSQICRNKVRVMVTRGRREGEILSICLIGLEFQICKMKKFWGLFHNGKKSNVNILNTTKPCT